MSTILEDAQAIVNGARRMEYGDPIECFDLIASFWGSYLKLPLTSCDVAQMMILLKIARGRNGYQQDTITDIAGYAYCADLISRPQDSTGD